MRHSEGVPRKSRELVAGGVYHVYARGNRKQPIFRDDEDRLQYLSIWGSVADDLGWHCLAYCLMENHVHHLVETPEPNLSEGVQLAHGLYGRYFNDKYEHVGHVFQGRFGSTRARTDGVLMYFACYVLLNPVRANLCATPELYPWSSYAATLEPSAGPRWLDIARLLDYFGSEDHFRQIVEAVRVMGAAGFEPATSRV